MKIGIIGAGQLGRMLALAGYPLGISCTFLDSDKSSPGGLVSAIHVGAFDDIKKLNVLASDVEVLTYEFENIPVEALKSIDSGIPIYPQLEALTSAQDRLLEKQLFQSLGIPTADYVPIDNSSDLESAKKKLGWPIVLKARRLGYDGRSQHVVNSDISLQSAWDDLDHVPSIAESWINFERELSIIASRGAEGETVYYPLSENVHENGILRTTVAPYDDSILQNNAQNWISAIMEKFNYRGTLTVEFFHTNEGLIANEMAPRVHNSGHWTIEGAETSQFENHLRAVLGLPLGDTKPRGCSAMLNLIGTMPNLTAATKIPGAHLHDYCKSPRPNRKLGHITLLSNTRENLLKKLQDTMKTLNRTSIS
ncbi:MAG: 5-(carboxyamino)imidazole ribonucleotide synthase [Rhodospirillaceae bacterium]|nr:5-(carboxyamino)imidazole ribonucleotide synthase [Rhodospirillaceae bacterium]